jgi:hypothetical protein
MKAKKELKFYKSIFIPIRVIDFFPIIKFSKNVQGYSFTRSYTLSWFKYAVTYFKTIESCMDIDMNTAHKSNVLKYMSK